MLLIPTSFISFRLSEFVRGSHAGPLDRSLGFVFGVGRGLLVVGLGYLIFSSLAPPKSHPEWVKEARLLPMVKGTADVIRSLSGGKAKDTEEADTETAAKEETTKEAPEAKHAENSEPKPETKTKPAGKTDTDNKKDGGDKGKSYGANDRREMDRLVRSLSKQ
jgi:membrane protein required for colicin V production